ncbi:MAG: hypothetical protein M0Z66_10995 [Thermaerobacter sp.]|nr:hypothetical protein [Thermaerobacter sp.]
MRVWHAGLLGAVGALLLASPALAAAKSPADIGVVEVAATYAKGGVDVFEIASAPAGSLVALPILPGAKNLRVGGGKYFLTQETTNGREAMVLSPKGSAQATFHVAYPPTGNFLFVWHTPAKIGRFVLLTGPKIHPSGLGIAPFALGGEVRVGGKLLTSFSATNLPAGYTIRWPFEVGDPGAWLGNLFLGLGIAVPVIALLLGLRAYAFGGRRRPAA